MVTVRLSVDRRPFEEQRQRLQRATADLNRVVQTVVLPALQARTDARLNTAPRVYTGKRDWDSEAQRKYVLAKLRREGNLPYKRSGRVLAWRAVLRPLPDGGEIREENPVDYSKWVFGVPYQSRIHRQPPWLPMQQFVDEAAPELADAVAAAFVRISEG